VSGSPGDATLCLPLLLVLTALFQCPSLGAAMTFECKPTGKGFGEEHCDDMEPEEIVWEERLKELRPWVLLVALQG